MSKEQRKINRNKEIQARKALRDQLKDDAVREYISKQRAQYFDAGYKRGWEEGVAVTTKIYAPETIKKEEKDGQDLETPYAGR